MAFKLLLLLWATGLIQGKVMESTIPFEKSANVESHFNLKNTPILVKPLEAFTICMRFKIEVFGRIRRRLVTFAKKLDDGDIQAHVLHRFWVLNCLLGVRDSRASLWNLWIILNCV